MRGLEIVSPEQTNPSMRAEDVAAVHQEVARLPERYRRAVVLCHFEGLTHAEAGRRLGCPPGTVGARVSRARDMLRSALNRRGVCPSAAIMAASIEPKFVASTVPLALERSTVQASLIFATTRMAATTIASATAMELANQLLGIMVMTRVATVGVLVLAVSVGAAGAGLLAGAAGQIEDPRKSQARSPTHTEPPRSPLPGLPGAVTKPPAWLLGNAPFDVAAFLAAPAPDDNAAPRYLDALFEFGPEVAVCFPQGPERESRLLRCRRPLAAIL